MNWFVVRYEDDDESLFMVIEYENGDRERVLIRHSNDMKW